MAHGVDDGHLGPDLRNVVAVRRLVDRPLARLWVADRAAEALLVASEIAMNAVQHAGTPFTVLLEWDDHDVTLRVTDGSSSVPTPPEPDLAREGGRRMQIIEAFTSSWGWMAHDGGKTVWAGWRRAT